MRQGKRDPTARVNGDLQVDLSPELLTSYATLELFELHLRWSLSSRRWPTGG